MPYRRRLAALTALSLIALPVLPGASSAGAKAPADRPAKAGDFDGDGRRDLAFGSPNGRVGDAPAAGRVFVVYGADPSRRQVITQSSPGVPGGPENGDRFGASLASADFDRDGYADLAVAAPGEDHSDAPLDGGRVTIVYGGPRGLSSRAFNIAGPPARFEAGGKEVYAGDFDGNGTADLAVLSYGKFWVFHRLDRRSPAATLVRIAGATGESAPAMAAAVGDFTGDRITDLAVSLVQQVSDADLWETFINVYRGSRPGLVTTPVFSDRQHKAHALAAGDFNGDGRADLAAGDIDGIPGRVRVFAGTPAGLGAPKVINQDSPGVPDRPEARDGFGTYLAAGDLDGDRRSDLVIGAPGEGIGSTGWGAGQVTVLYGSPSGVPGTRARALSQNTPGIPGTAEGGDLFGKAVATGDVLGGPRTDLIIGSWGENGAAGAVFVLRGSPTGVTVEGLRAFYPATLGFGTRAPRLGGVLLGL